MNESSDPAARPGHVRDGDGDALEPVTERQAEKKREDREYVPVVVKRTDQVIRHPDDVLEIAISEGYEQSERPVVSLVLSAISSGAILTFSAMAVGILSTIGDGQADRVLHALVYPLGFVLCLMSGTQLFTEHTALAVYPVLDRRASVGGMLRVWITVLAGNLVGCALGAGLLVGAEGVVGAADGYAEVADKMLSYTAPQTLLSALLAGWLMALGGWLMLSTPPDLSQVVLIYITTFLIGLAGLHHSIAGTSELFAAWFTGAEFAASAAAGTLFLAVVGNLIGGSLFVAILNYGQIRQTQRRDDD